MSNLIKDLNSNEKPREKMINIGAQNLTNEEILAIILRTGGKNISAIGLAREILNKFGGFMGLLKAHVLDISKYKNVGIAKATGIKAACELGLRMKDSKTKEQIQKPEDAYDLLRKYLYGKTKEYLYLISLNNKKHVISIDLLSIGIGNQTLVDTKEIYRVALAKNASYVIIAHNHPSNEGKPSSEDIKITEKIAQTGKSVGIPLIDHIIFCDETFFSLKASGIFETYKS